MPLVIHLLLLEALLHVGLLLDLLQVAASGDLPVLFFLLLVDLTHALLLLDRLLGLLADAVENFAALLIFDRPTLLFPLVLDPQHIIGLVPVQFLLCLDLLLSLGALLVEVHLEGVLELALLGSLVGADALLDLVLVAQDGTPLVEYLLLLLDGQVAALSWRALGCSKKVIGLLWLMVLGAGIVGDRLSGIIHAAIETITMVIRIPIRHQLLLLMMSHVTLILGSGLVRSIGVVLGHDGWHGHPQIRLTWTTLRLELRLSRYGS